MSMRQRTPLLLALLAFPLLALGCGGKTTSDEPELARRKGELQQIYELYSQFWKKNQKPPKQLSDITQKEDEMVYDSAVRALKKGEYLVIFGVSGPDAGTVLAYEKDAPKEGGFVLMADGSVSNQSADALKAKLK